MDNVKIQPLGNSDHNQIHFDINVKSERKKTYLFNLSLEEGTVPSEWKEANITPLFKKGSRNKPENYRPVSLTLVVCKLLETLIRDHMVEFLVKHKLINTSQHGFLKARSCLTNLLCFFKKLQSG